jgi:hypothetical protein
VIALHQARARLDTYSVIVGEPFAVVPRRNLRGLTSPPRHEPMRDSGQKSHPQRPCSAMMTASALLRASISASSAARVVLYGHT